MPACVCVLDIVYGPPIVTESDTLYAAGYITLFAEGQIAHVGATGASQRCFPESHTSTPIAILADAFGTGVNRENVVGNLHAFRLRPWGLSR
jgi:hypothetical protein